MLVRCSRCKKVIKRRNAIDQFNGGRWCRECGLLPASDTRPVHLDQPVVMVKCSTCKQDKPDSEYSYNNYNTSGLCGICKQCQRAYDNETRRILQGV